MFQIKHLEKKKTIKPPPPGYGQCPIRAAAARELIERPGPTPACAAARRVSRGCEHATVPLATAPCARARARRAPSNRRARRPCRPPSRRSSWRPCASRALARSPLTPRACSAWLTRNAGDLHASTRVRVDNSAAQWHSASEGRCGVRVGGRGGVVCTASPWRAQPWLRTASSATERCKSAARRKLDGRWRDAARET